MSALATVTTKLSKLIPLLGSDQPGEVVAAATAIHRTLQSAGCDFHDLVAVIESPPPAARPRTDFHSEPDVDLQEMVEFCVHHAGSLTPKEASFVRQMHRHVTMGWHISIRQQAWLESIHAKLRRFS